MGRDFGHERHFFHSFPRPKVDESKDATLERGLSILAFMKEFGLVLAPEIVKWDVSVISGHDKQLDILQRRACFTELSVAELPSHSGIFGPIALSFDLAKLRSAGATPVIYVPQGVEASALSQIGIFCANGAYHTQHVLSQLNSLKELSDPVLAAKKFGRPVDPNYELHLQNSDSVGNVVAKYTIPASSVHDVLQYVGFNNIPFDHSIGVLNVFLNMFYPTDNTHTGDELGYYRQREWRLIAGDIHLNGRSIGRSLSEPEITRLQEIDRHFWTRELMVDGVARQRSSLALVYEPVPNWNFFELVETIFVPEYAVERVRAIFGNKVPVHPCA
jgi:hypothetical protein